MKPAVFPLQHRGRRLRAVTKLPPALHLAALRSAGFALMLAAGAVTVAFVHPFASLARRRQLRSLWSRAALRTLGVRLQTQGRRPSPATFLVANHVSWLDILAINAIVPVTFVCKREVRAWPLIGWLAARNETIFMSRRSAAQAREVNVELARRLAEGATVAVFPEGTTTDGRSVLPFRAALLQSAIDSGAAVLPLALRYTDAQGNPCLEAAFVGDMTFLQSLLAVTGVPRMIAQVKSAAPLASAPAERRLLAHRARKRIATLLGQAAPRPPAHRAAIIPPSPERRFA